MTVRESWKNKYREVVVWHVATNLPAYGLLILLIIMSCHYFNAVQDIRLVCSSRPEYGGVLRQPRNLKEQADSVCEDYKEDYDLPDN